MDNHKKPLLPQPHLQFWQIYWNTNADYAPVGEMVLRLNICAVQVQRASRSHTPKPCYI